MYDLDNSTSTLIKKASKLYVRLASQYLKEIGIPYAYTSFLIYLWQEDQQSQKMLYEKVGIEQATAVRTLDRMERDDFIYRQRSQTDRRVYHICLTEKAKKLQLPTMKIAEQINIIGLEGITNSEKKAFNSLLRKCIVNIEQIL